MKTKTTTRRSFTDEFKREAVSLLASSGRPLTQIATELGIERTAEGRLGRPGRSTGGSAVSGNAGNPPSAA
jgi:transposase-like protein